jgi:hypothetical protein
MFTDSVATPIRMPSTANLLIDSFDRDPLGNESSTNFSISKAQNVLSGFFTRFGIVEVVLDYFIPNISPLYSTNKLSISSGGNTHEITLPTGNYTVAAVMEQIITQFNTGGAGQTPLFPNVNFSFAGGLPGNVNFNAFAVPTPPVPVPFTINDTPLARMLNLQRGLSKATYPVISPYLIPTQLTYIDFVCSNITYQQGLKDATTSNATRDVLYRWNFGWSEVYILDPDGYPINQGYLPFLQRRYLNYPKQCKWDTQQPLGQLSFQLYDRNGNIINIPASSSTGQGGLEWSMALLVSEQ